MTTVRACPGPLVWFDVPASDRTQQGAVLECATCSYVVTTGSVNDAAHTDTPVMKEGLSA